jgi:putative Holliday junction resolvase
MDVYKRILGLDIGDKRIGLAITDELGMTAQPIGKIDRAQTDADFEKIIEVAKEYDAASIVAGLPKKLDGTYSAQTEKTEAFIVALRGQTDLPVHTWDERLTTTSAEATLIQGNVRRKARRKVVDSMAAQIMLQHYLDCDMHKTEARAEEGEG